MDSLKSNSARLGSSGFGMWSPNFELKLQESDVSSDG